MSTAVGVVHLVGAGPGDPRLLTRRAARLLREADVVVADRPSAASILALARPAAERVYVGRTEMSAAWTMDAVVELLSDRAQDGKTVVRLKSGDPFVCSRGGEEVAALTRLGVRCVTTPGVSAGLVAPLVAGGDRGLMVTVASGDDDPAAAPAAWEELVDSAATLVVLTGRAHQRRIAARLMYGGLSPETPVSIVHAATRPQARVMKTTVADLGSVRLPPPAAFVVSPSLPNGGEHAHP